MPGLISSRDGRGAANEVAADFKLTLLQLEASGSSKKEEDLRRGAAEIYMHTHVVRTTGARH